MSDEASTELREPRNRVCPRAIGYWRLTAFITTAILGLPLLLASWGIPGLPTWAPVIAFVLVAAMLVWAIVMPSVRYRIHRWEVTPTAIHTRAGWLSIDQRIAPLSRVQTVDSSETALMRLFGLRSVTATTASAAGPIIIEGLDAEEATRVVSDLTAIVGEAEGDAT